MIKEQVARQGVHSLSAKENDVVTAVDRYVDTGVCVDTVAPMRGAVCVSQGEGELGIALKVGSVDGDLARVGDRCGVGILPDGETG